MIIFPYFDLRVSKGDGVVINSTQVYGGVALFVKVKTFGATTLHHHKNQCHFAFIAFLQ